jgi:hypothetical protein
MLQLDAEPAHPADAAAARVASCLRCLGAFPPVDFLAVAFVRAMRRAAAAGVSSEPALCAVSLCWRSCFRK